MKKSTFMTHLVDTILAKYSIFRMEPFRLQNTKASAGQDEQTEKLWRFCEDELQFYDKETDAWVNDDAMLCNLARGAFLIQKEPFSPKLNERYYYIAWIDPVKEPYVTEDAFTGDILDIFNLIHGNCFHTPGDAAAKKQETYNRIFQNIRDTAWR